MSDSDQSADRGNLGVHLLHEPSGQALAHLESGLDAAVALTFGTVLPDPAGFFSAEGFYGQEGNQFRFFLMEENF